MNSSKYIYSSLTHLSFPPNALRQTPTTTRPRVKKLKGESFIHTFIHSHIPSNNLDSIKGTNKQQQLKKYKFMVVLETVCYDTKIHRIFVVSN